MLILNQVDVVKSHVMLICILGSTLLPRSNDKDRIWTLVRSVFLRPLYGPYRSTWILLVISNNFEKFTGILVIKNLFPFLKERVIQRLNTGEMLRVCLSYRSEEHFL
jgi:hypothetical protein